MKIAVACDHGGFRLKNVLVEYLKDNGYEVEDFGCFVELWPGCEGLVHVSELDHKRVDKPKDVVSVGDKILVKALGYDNRGRLNLSRKQALPKTDKKEDKKSKKK